MKFIVPIGDKALVFNVTAETALAMEAGVVFDYDGKAGTLSNSQPINPRTVKDVFVQGMMAKGAPAAKGAKAAPIEKANGATTESKRRTLRKSARKKRGKKKYAKAHK